jgi:hypothetical protein
MSGVTPRKRLVKSKELETTEMSKMQGKMRITLLKEAVEREKIKVAESLKRDRKFEGGEDESSEKD